MILNNENQLIIEAFRNNLHNKKTKTLFDIILSSKVN